MSVFYQWSHGQDGEDPVQLVSGLYTVTITDDHQCTNTLSNIFVDADLPPIADEGNGLEIDCSQDLLTLNGGGSSLGGSIIIFGSRVMVLLFLEQVL